jgi:hypothetical protein
MLLLQLRLVDKIDFGHVLAGIVDQVTFGSALK